MAVLDQVSDSSGVHLHRLTNIIQTIPEFVKIAERTTAEDVKSIASSTFGDRANKRFPCHTKAACFLSHLYFLDSEPEILEKEARNIRENLDRMATVWGLDGPNGSVTQLKHAFDKRAADAWSDLSDSDYGLVVKQGEQEIKLFPMPNAVSVKKAAETLYVNRDKYPYAWRKVAAAKILQKVVEAKVELADDTDAFLHKAAGYGFSTADQLQQGLLQRAGAISMNPRMKSAATAMRKYAEEIVTTPIDSSLLEKVASFLDELDRRLGLHQKYISRYSNQIEVPMPEEIAFATTEKEAQEKMATVIILTNGEVFMKGDLEKAGHDAFCAALGDDIEDTMFDPVTKRLDLEKASNILPTLPRDDADNLSTALYSAGVRPIDRAGLKSITKEASVSFDAAMDLNSWKDFVPTGNRGVKPRLMTRADEIGAVTKPGTLPTFII